MPTIAIVGASLAGSSAAATLREEGFDGRVVLIGAEPQPPYDRPPLSKNYLRGGMPFEKALLRPLEFYRERNIEMRLGTTVATNALIEGKTASLGMLTTRGFRDILEIGRQIRSRLYDVHLTKPADLQDLQGLLATEKPLTPSRQVG